MKWQLADKALHSDFLRVVEERSGQNLSDCYQCGKCTGGCPVAADLALSPNRVLRLVQLGLEAEALGNETVWCCAACGTCNSRCPMGVDIVRVIDVLRGLAQERRVPPSNGAERVWTFYRAFLDCVREFGRLSEVALMASYNMNSGRLFTNLTKAPWYFLKGKITLSPHKVHRIERLERVFQRCEEEVAPR
ncbi:MAG TPA: 4Fe-4S dicluster domain-containing protein [Planctomycetota bacterium]|nr:4Fe-4S dicluster domain-containing protein [Planctomycetota bacterium]HRR82165.1 4Fe-4S dicluster domain-containing protein [Planctomycetota bacterium]HRT96904.1 4Fe-4S dicluster domain-containing protein [Planctomycetota bacterium]